MTPGPLSVEDVCGAVHKLTNALLTTSDSTGAFLLQVPDGRQIDTVSWNGWDWTQGIGLYGLWSYFTLSQIPRFLHIVHDWFEARFSEGGTTKNINTMAAMLPLACLYEAAETSRYEYLPHLEDWSRWAYAELPRTQFGGFQHVTYENLNAQQLWADTMMMTALPLAKIGLVLDHPDYVEEAGHQFLLHIKYLFNPSSGLFFHGWQFNTAEGVQDGQGHNFGRVHWARGNSWLTIAIPEFLDLLNGDSAWQRRTTLLRTHLQDTLQAQCRALCHHQTSSGLWCTILDETEENGSYAEASASAGFACGMLKALRRGYLVREPTYDYEAVALKAVEGIWRNINQDGKLMNVSFGTGVGDDAQHYKEIPRTTMPYGQAMAILALTEYQKYITEKW